MSLLEETLMSKLIYLIMQQKLKNVTHVDVSNFALKSNLASLKTEVDKLNIDKLTPVHDVSIKTEYDKLVTKVDNTDDTTGFVLNTTYDTGKLDLEKKISDADKKTF